MQNINYKHLHYFWVIAKSGGVAKAGEQLHVTPQSISSQMRLLEASVGEPLWRRAGRKLELTETGNLVFDYADRLFSVGEELKDALHNRSGRAQGLFRVGVVDVVAKAMAHSLLAPALALPDAPRLNCREGRFADLLALLAVHKLDLVISDRAMPASMNVRGFNHLLVECGVSFLATPALASSLNGEFPASLNQAPMLMPGEDSTRRQRLFNWFGQLDIHPRIVADFDDSALMKAFGKDGSGVFALPSLVAGEVASDLNLCILGSTEAVTDQIYAITGERRIKHPAAIAISIAARDLPASAGA